MDCHNQNGTGQKRGFNIVMLLCMIVPAAAILALTVFKVSFSQLLYFGIILLCPLMHIFMMKGMHNNQGNSSQTNQNPNNETDTKD